MLAVLLLMLVVAAPVSAEEEGSAERAYLEACLAAAGGRTEAARATCFGQVSEVCLASRQPTTIDMATCADCEVSVWEELLDDTYARLVETQPPERMRVINAAQAAWRGWRTARCAVYSTYDGTIFGPLAALCVAETTSLRTVDLWQIETGFVGE